MGASRLPAEGSTNGVICLACLGWVLFMGGVFWGGVVWISRAFLPLLAN